jgi:periplasmic divalent cation tolerance protein
MSDVLVVLVTVPSPPIAARIATALVKEKLAACVNVVPGVRSIYVWKGKVCDGKELLLAIKTTRARYPEVERRVKELHPYSVPEVIALPVARGSAAYLAWVREGVK